MDAFELPADTSEDDRVLLHNLLTVLEASSPCRSYRVDVTATGFRVRGALAVEAFEVDSDDLHVIASVSPLRVERVAVSRAAGQNELVVTVLNAKQRVMAATAVACFKRRKLRHVS